MRATKRLGVLKRQGARREEIWHFAVSPWMKGACGKMSTSLSYLFCLSLLHSKPLHVSHRKHAVQINRSVQIHLNFFFRKVPNFYHKAVLLFLYHYGLNQQKVIPCSFAKWFGLLISVKNKMCYLMQTSSDEPLGILCSPCDWNRLVHNLQHFHLILFPVLVTAWCLSVTDVDIFK